MFSGSNHQHEVFLKDNICVRNILFGITCLNEVKISDICRGTWNNMWKTTATSYYIEKTPANLIFYSWHYVNMRILLEINAGKHWKHVENIINAMLDLKTSSNFLLQRIFKFKYTFRVYKSLVFQYHQTVKWWHFGKL